MLIIKSKKRTIKRMLLSSSSSSFSSSLLIITLIVTNKLMNECRRLLLGLYCCCCGCCCCCFGFLPLLLQPSIVVVVVNAENINEVSSSSLSKRKNNGDIYDIVIDKNGFQSYNDNDGDIDDDDDVDDEKEEEEYDEDFLNNDSNDKFDDDDDDDDANSSSSSLGMYVQELIRDADVNILDESHDDTIISTLRSKIDENGGSQVVSTPSKIDGRPLLYNACVGLMLSTTTTTTSTTATTTRDDMNTNNPNNAAPVPAAAASSSSSSSSSSVRIFQSILSLLVDEYGAYIDQRTQGDGACHRPPLHLVSRSCSASSVNEMLIRKSDPNISDDEGWTALMATCMGPPPPPPPPNDNNNNNNNDKMKKGIGNDDSMCVETARVLLDGLNNVDGAGTAVVRARIDDVNYRGYTALHLACEMLKPTLVKLFLEYGANVTKRTLFGETPLGLIESAVASLKNDMENKSIDNDDDDDHDHDEEKEDEEVEDKIKRAKECRDIIFSHISKNTITTKISSSSNNSNNNNIEAITNRDIMYIEEEKKSWKLMNLLHNVLIPAAENPDILTADEQRIHILRASISYVGLNPDKLLGKSITTMHKKKKQKRSNNNSGNNKNENKNKSDYQDYDDTNNVHYDDDDDDDDDHQDNNDDDNDDLNWYEIYHKRIMSLIPNSYLKTYNLLHSSSSSSSSSSHENYPNNDELDLISIHSMDARELSTIFSTYSKHGFGVRRIDKDILHSNLFEPYRKRGYSPTLMNLFSLLVVNPAQHGIAYAIPSNFVLDNISKKYGPIVEVGAGTGYWTSLLRSRGVDVLAYDSNPPGLNDGKSLSKHFIEWSYVDVDDDEQNGSGVEAEAAAAGGGAVRRGECKDIFNDKDGIEIATNRALLIIWPNNADFVDNPHLLERKEEEEEEEGRGGGDDYDKNDANIVRLPIWDVECLQAYINAGGSTVIYVGEREDNIQTMMEEEQREKQQHQGEWNDKKNNNKSRTYKYNKPDCGFCSSRKFQYMLKDQFELIEVMKCPQWFQKEDDVTVWKIKKRSRE